MLSLEVLSGASENSDTKRGRKPKTTTKFSPLNELDDGTSCFVNDNGGAAGGSNTINPPFVQCATFALQGRSCVFALGDGSVCRPIYTMASEIR